MNINRTKINFAALFATVWLTNIGNGMHTIVVGKLLYNMTGNVTAFGWVILFQHIFNSIVQLFAGSFVDRGNPKKIMIVADFVRGIAIIVASLFMTKENTPTLILFITLVIGFAKPFYRSASFAIVPQVIPEKWLARFYSYRATSLQTGQIIGIAIAGPLVFYFGEVFTFALDGFTYLSAGVCLFLLPNIKFKAKKNKAKKMTTLFLDWKEVYIFLKDNLNFLALVLLCAGDFLAIICLNLALVPLIETFAEGNANYLSLVDGGFAVGSILASLASLKFFGKMKRKFVAPFFLAWQGILFIIITQLWSFPQGLPIYLLTFITFLIGFSNTVSLTIFMSTLQNKSKKQMKGRIGALRHILFSLSTLILMPFLTMALNINLFTGLWTFGVLCLIYSLMTFLMGNYIWKADLYQD